MNQQSITTEQPTIGPVPNTVIDTVADTVTDTMAETVTNTTIELTPVVLKQSQDATTDKATLFDDVLVDVSENPTQQRGVTRMEKALVASFLYLVAICVLSTLMPTHLFCRLDSNLLLVLSYVFTGCQLVGILCFVFIVFSMAVAYKRTPEPDYSV
ncbi:hypothetical protein NEDG_00380 [Nematocida displodere]|uniref:Uncharacterized protein n=1 Tax=Nematocida displodere TaxID=1805483 RepID=A0A177EIX4_9MICR|nr:hypothetical protein NEDG_00380 [Nematocida displodere]